MDVKFSHLHLERTVLLMQHPGGIWRYANTQVDRQEGPPIIVFRPDAMKFLFKYLDHFTYLNNNKKTGQNIMP